MISINIRDFTVIDIKIFNPTNNLFLLNDQILMNSKTSILLLLRSIYELGKKITFARLLQFVILIK